MIINNLRRLLGCTCHKNVKDFKYGQDVGSIIFTTSLPIEQDFTWSLTIPGLYKIETLENKSGSMVYEFKFSSPQTAQWVYEALIIYEWYENEKELRWQIQSEFNNSKKDKEKE